MARALAVSHCSTVKTRYHWSSWLGSYWRNELSRHWPIRMNCHWSSCFGTRRLIGRWSVRVCRRRTSRVLEIIRTEIVIKLTTSEKIYGLYAYHMSHRIVLYSGQCTLYVIIFMFENTVQLHCLKLCFTAMYCHTFIQVSHVNIHSVLV